MNFKKKTNSSIFLTNKKDLKKNKFIIKYFEEIKDEIICFIDKNGSIKIFSSICPHFGGEIYYDHKNDYLRCKWHDWKFCKKTGECLSYPVKIRLNPYEFNFKPNKLKNYNLKYENEDIFLIYKDE